MITGQTVKNTYQGDGSNREFTITFEFTDASQIKFKVNGQNVTTNFALNTVAKTLTYPTVASELDPLTSADEIEIYRDTEITQDIEFNNGGPLNADMIEDGLDKLTMIAQELGAREINLVAGNGIDIEGNVISLKGLKVMPEGTDIDDLKEDGVYFINNPTSTKGMPTVPNFNTNVSSTFSLVRVTNVPANVGSYFVYQELVLWYKHSGIGSIGEPTVFSRTLTDYTYIMGYNGWITLTDAIFTVSKTGTSVSVGSYADRNCQIIMNPSGYGSAVPNTPITSLTIVNYTSNLLGKTRVIFKAGSGFTLTVQGQNYWIGTKPTTWTEGNIYMITMEAGFMKCEELTMS